MPRRHIALLGLGLVLAFAHGCGEESTAPETYPPVEDVPPLEPAAGPWAGQAVAFTFTSDDGDRAANLAWADVFHAREVRYTLFIITGQVGLSTRLTAAEIRSLHDQGFEIGAHSRTHIRLTEASDEKLQDELAGARADLEAMLGGGYVCRTLSYPQHAHDRRVMDAAEAAGYTSARDGGTGAAGHPNFSEGAATWKRTSLFEVPVTVTAKWLTHDNDYTERETRSRVRSLIAAARQNQVWINVYAHFLSDIDRKHMEWIVDELLDSGAWIATFDQASIYWMEHSGKDEAGG